MKKRFFTTLVALSAFLAVSADDYFDEQGGFSIRPFAGINVSGITVGSQEVSKSIIGFHGGVEAEYRLNYLFGISAGVGFSAEGGKMKYPMNSGFLAHGGDTEKWNYLEIFHTLGLSHPKGNSVSDGIMNYPPKQPSGNDALIISNSSFLPSIFK